MGSCAHDGFRVNAFSVGYIRDLVQNRGSTWDWVRW